MLKLSKIRSTTIRSVAFTLAACGMTAALSANGTALMAQETEAVASNTMPDPEVEAEERLIGEGMASYYGKNFAGNRTANGERFDPGQLTAAHRTLPFGSQVRVTHHRTGRSVIVRINDRGPFHGNRVIDVSESAARQLGLIGPGVGRVTLSLIG